MQFAKALDHILGTIRAIAHKNCYRVASKLIEAFSDRKTKTGRGFLVDGAERRVETWKILEDGLSIIRTVIVDYYNLMVDLVSSECLHQQTHNLSN